MVDLQRRTVFLMHSLNFPGILSTEDTFEPKLVKKRHSRQLGARKSGERVEWRNIVQRESHAIKNPKPGEPHHRRHGAGPEILGLPPLSVHSRLG
jgi:hypothetical protein